MATAKRGLLLLVFVVFDLLITITVSSFYNMIKRDCCSLLLIDTETDN